MSIDRTSAEHLFLKNKDILTRYARVVITENAFISVKFNAVADKKTGNVTLKIALYDYWVKIEEYDFEQFMQDALDWHGLQKIK
jgi:hypothetical protein